MPTVITVVGARPQFVKAAAVSDRLAEAGGRLREVMVHTGQHFDRNMSDVFFEELRLPAPHLNLGVDEPSPALRVGRMLAGLDEALREHRPHLVLVYGDTDSTLAGALAGAKLGVPVAHVEAGLRSYDQAMPEELNRRLTDHTAALLFCPTQVAVDNLAAEGLRRGAHLVGDVMYDMFCRVRAKHLAGLRPSPDGEVLVTCHRAENTDDPRRLRNIVAAVDELAGLRPVTWLMHPRTAKALAAHGLAGLPRRAQVLPPCSYLEMMARLARASLLLTDSSGLQKEAYFLRVPCLTLRGVTEWPETLAGGDNRLVGADPEAIASAAGQVQAPLPGEPKAFGDGQAARRIVDILLDWLT